MIINACTLQEMEKSGLPSSDFSGVPVFEVLLLASKSGYIICILYPVLLAI